MLPTLSTSILCFDADHPPMDYGERLGRALELARKERGQLASALGISSQAVGQVIRGKTGAFTAENNARAARFLEVDSFWLATGEGEPRTLLMMERLALSTRAVYVGQLLDQLESPAQRDRAYALIVQMLEFGGLGPM